MNAHCLKELRSSGHTIPRLLGKARSSAAAHRRMVKSTHHRPSGLASLTACTVGSYHSAAGLVEPLCLHAGCKIKMTSGIVPDMSPTIGFQKAVGNSTRLGPFYRMHGTANQLHRASRFSCQALTAARRLVSQWNSLSSHGHDGRASAKDRLALSAGCSLGCSGLHENPKTQKHPSAPRRREFSSLGNESSDSVENISGSNVLSPHPTLAPSVKICSACSASATPTEHSSAQGLAKGASMVWEDAEDLLTQRRAHLVWDSEGPRTAFLVKKKDSQLTANKLKEIATWLEGKGIKVLVESRVSREFPQYEVFDPSKNEADFCVTLGGDGTVLHLTSLFVADEPLPPVVAFAMGTLGFLTPYDVGDFKGALDRVLDANNTPVFCTLRTRKCCEVFQNGERTAVHHVLNECLVDRGSSPAMVTLQVSADRHHLTTVQADGLIISTPSGSTAYSMSAGGPMVAPSVAGTLITPIAPHSLSFRPLVVPESSEIVVQIPVSARSVARASFDGRHTMRLARGSAIRCTTSKCALPMVSLGYLDRDWMEAIRQKLRWNEPIRDTGAEAPADYHLPLPPLAGMHASLAVPPDYEDEEDGSQAVSYDGVHHPGHLGKR